MASYTALLKLTQPDLGATGWGTTVNSGVTALVEQAVAGAVSVAVTAAGPNTLSAIASGASSDARNQFIILTGTLSGPATLTVPAAPGATSSKLYFIKNSAGDAVTVETSGGASVSVPNGKSMMLKVTTAGVEEAMTHAASLTLGTALAATSGGTGQSSYAVGDLLYAGTTTTLAKLAAVATGSVLRSKGVGTAPAYEQVVLTTDVTGVLPVANGGTGAATLTLNNVLLGNGTSAVQVVAPGSTGNVLRSDGTTWTSSALASATTSAEGLVELATDAEVRTGTDTTRAITPDALRKGALVFDTVRTPTSGTTVDFTSIPSWVKRITVMFAGVSTSGSNPVIIQLGDAGGFENTGYLSSASYGGVAGNYASSTTGFIVDAGNTAAAATTRRGVVVIVNLNGNQWVCSGTSDTGVVSASIAGSKTLSDVLTQVRITNENSVDTFDAGSINILYE
jgi:hypothetical protein